MCRSAILGRLTITAAALACSIILAAPTLAQQTPQNDKMQQSAPDPSADLATEGNNPSDWPMAPRDYANTRFSALKQITSDNVGDLSVAWTFSVGADRGQEAAPLIVNGTMYVVAPYAGPHPNQVFALDAATGE